MTLRRDSYTEEDAKRRRERMRQAVASLVHYMSTYDRQPGYEDYRDETFIEDVLYGIGRALDKQYQFANGFDLFKHRLREHLGSSSSGPNDDARDAARFRWLAAGRLSEVEGLDAGEVAGECLGEAIDREMRRDATHSGGSDG